jgi:hypothetical protein
VCARVCGCVCVCVCGTISIADNMNHIIQDDDNYDAKGKRKGDVVIIIYCKPQSWLDFYQFVITKILLWPTNLMLTWLRRMLANYVHITSRKVCGITSTYYFYFYFIYYFCFNRFIQMMAKNALYSCVFTMPSVYKFIDFNIKWMALLWF